MYLREAIEEWSMCGLLWRQVMPGYVIYLMSVVKISKGGNEIVSDGLNWSPLKLEGSTGCSSILLM